MKLARIRPSTVTITRTREPSPWFIALLAAWTSIGCQEEWASVADRWPTRSVSGRVVVGDQPIQSGWIEFLPVDGTRGTLRSAPLQADGRFTIDDVGQGEHALRVIRARPAPPGGLLFEGFQSPIRRVVPPGSEPPSTWRIDLSEEYYKALTTVRTTGQGASP